jgi:hypothetical protein
MICDYCGVHIEATSSDWIEVKMATGREYRLCSIGHLLDFFYELECEMDGE